MTKIAACNIVGPDGNTVFAGMPVPGEWGEDLVSGLEEGGGIVDDEVTDEDLQEVVE